MNSNTITLAKPIVKKNDEMAVSSIQTPQQLIAFLQGAEGKVLLRSTCCEVWVPVSLIMSGGGGGSTQIGYNSTDGNAMYQFNPGFDVIGVSVDGQVYYPTSTFPAQQYSYDANTGLLTFAVAPQAGLNMSFLYIV